MRRVLVTGGAGSLGQHMAARLLRAGYETLWMPGEDIDALARAAARRAVRSARPDVVVDCALADAGYQELVRSASNLAVAACDTGAHSVYLSSVEVFDGAAGVPYLESDAPRPVTPRGEALAKAETGVARANPRHAIIRSSALFGFGTGDAVDVVLAAARSGLVEADPSVKISPTYSMHLADAAVAVVQRHDYGVFHAPGGGSCTELQFARTVLRITRSEAKAVPLPPDARSHPARSLVLASCRDVPPCPNWRIALQTYLKLHAIGAEERDGLHS